MGQDPELIRQQIAETRAEMGETADALSYKADVKGRAKDNVQGKVDAVSDKVTAVKERIVGSASQAADATPSTDDLRSSVAEGAGAAKQTTRKAASVAQENPLGLALGAVAIGFLGGLLLPASRIENEKLGPVADDLKAQAREAGEEVFERGKEAASEAVHAAQDAAAAATDAAKSSVQDKTPAAAH